MVQALVSKWNEDRILQQAASLSYYTIFSIAPLLIIMIAIAGIVLGHNVVQADVTTQIEGLVGKDGAQLINTIIKSINQPAASIPAAILGFIALILGAIGVFGQLKSSLNQIWRAPIRPSAGLIKDLIDLFRQSAILMLMVVVMGLLIMLSVIVSAVLSSIAGFVDTQIGDPLRVSTALWSMVNFWVSIGLMTLLFAAIFKILPDVAIKWKDVWIGSFLTAALFTLGKYLIGLYLGRSGVTSAYGAAGSLVIILLWVNYSAQIFFLGAEFTHIYTLRYGSAAYQQRHHVQPTPELTPSAGPLPQ
jgi:membrane protein